MQMKRPERSCRSFQLHTCTETRNYVSELGSKSRRRFRKTKTALTTQIHLCYEGGFRKSSVPPQFNTYTNSHGILVVLITEDTGLSLAQKPPCASTMLGATWPEPPSQMVAHFRPNAGRNTRYLRGTKSKALSVSNLLLEKYLSTAVWEKKEGRSTILRPSSNLLSDHTE